MPGLVSLGRALVDTINESRADVVLTALNQQTDSPEETFIFQYVPETFSDTKAVNYQSREIPGGSLPIYQWVNSGERVISFTATFTTDIDFLAHGENKQREIYDRLKAEGLERRNVDIRTALAWLRQNLLPTYRQGGDLGTPLTFAPRKIRLWMPGTGIGAYGGFQSGPAVSPDSVVSILTQCDISIEAQFPSGLPRVATAQLSFSQVAQIGGTVQFPQAVVGEETFAGQTLVGDVFGSLPYSLTARRKSGI